MESVQIGGEFFSGSVYGQGQLIKPASNVNGVIIRTGTFYGGPNSRVTTGTTAATSLIDPKPVVAAPSQGMPAILSYPVSLPAGYGLWFDPNTSGAAFITYDFL